MLKKIFVAVLICLGIFAVEHSINLSNVSANSNFQFQPLTTGEYYWATVVNCNEWISLRREPSVYSDRIYKIPLGTVVKIYRGAGEHYGSPYNGFYQTYYNGAWGWCLQEYIRVGSHAGSAI